MLSVDGSSFNDFVFWSWTKFGIHVPNHILSVSWGMLYMRSCGLSYELFSHIFRFNFCQLCMTFKMSTKILRYCQFQEYWFFIESLELTVEPMFSRSHNKWSKNSFCDLGISVGLGDFFQQHLLRKGVFFIWNEFLFSDKQNVSDLPSWPIRNSEEHCGRLTDITSSLCRTNYFEV